MIRAQRSSVLRVVTAVAVTSMLAGCSQGSAEQDAFLSAARGIAAPDGFTIADEAQGVCPALHNACDDPGVVWTYLPTDATADPAEMCPPFLAWLGEQGVTEIFIGSELEWEWYWSPESYGQVEDGTVPTFDLGSSEALTACAGAISDPANSDGGAGLAAKKNVFGAVASDVVSDSVFIARLMTTRSMPDFNPDDRGVPFMLLAGFHER